MSDTLDGKVVWIAGASGALGSAVTREFAQTQARLALSSRSTKKLQELVAENGLPAGRVFTITADVTQVDEVEELAAAIARHFGQVDVLLNAVGGWSGGKPVAETTIEEWDHMLALNLDSAFLLSRAVLPYMLRAGWGRIIHVSSRTAVEPRAKVVGYAVSKMGLITLTEVIATEVKGTGITANVILPSVIDTPANRDSFGTGSASRADPGRWVPPERIAAMMRFLCSEAAASINGAAIPIYGAV